MSNQPEYILAGVLMKQHLAAKDTAGAFSMFENRSQGPSRTPIHVHEHDDETLYMLEGEMGAMIAGKEQSVKAGQTLFLPRGVPHQLMNVSGLPTHYLLLCTPSGFEGFLAEAGHLRASGEQPQTPTTEEIERMKVAAPRFGITLLSGW
jgi:quercetin dioxygenase-like cupin family protein